MMAKVEDLEGMKIFQKGRGFKYKGNLTYEMTTVEVTM